MANLFLMKLNPGWCSAMAQGHGISVLVRAAQITGETRFWDAAELALKPFTQTGFLAVFLLPFWLKPRANFD